MIRAFNQIKLRRTGFPAASYCLVVSFLRCYIAPHTVPKSLHSSEMNEINSGEEGGNIGFIVDHAIKLARKGFSGLGGKPVRMLLGMHTLGYVDVKITLARPYG